MFDPKQKALLVVENQIYKAHENENTNLWDGNSLCARLYTALGHSASKTMEILTLLNHSVLS